MSEIRLVTTRLQNSGKRGDLKPDNLGYYTVVIGGLNIDNSVGERYVGTDAVKRLFDNNSDLKRRLIAGNLKGENGHPKPLPGMKQEDFYRRVMSIEETNISHHFADIWLDDEFGKKNPEYNNSSIIGILAKVKPAGPHAAALQAALDNPLENVNFSIRALSRNNYRAGKTNRELEFIQTWDWVTEPGLAVANKWSSPALESLDFALSERVIERMIAGTDAAVATESTMVMAHTALRAIQEVREARVHKPAIYKGW